MATQELLVMYDFFFGMVEKVVIIIVSNTCLRNHAVCKAIEKTQSYQFIELYFNCVIVKKTVNSKSVQGDTKERLPLHRVNSLFVVRTVNVVQFCIRLVANFSSILFCVDLYKSMFSYDL